MTLTDVTVTGNRAVLAGGGISLSGSAVFLGSTKILSNVAQLGGGISVAGFSVGGITRVPTLTATGTLIDGNTAISSAGIAISGNVDAVKPTVTLNDVTISNNIAEQTASGTITVNITILAPDKLTIVAPRGNGGGMTVTRGDVTVNGGLITGNLATIAGGFAHQL